MKWTSLNEIREKFLKFFESKEHLILQSAPLLPQDDASLLLINSGMAPLKKYFLGLEAPPSKRAASCQKCIRTPDIERVGKTSRHGTYFEMLGNFSFGDYFKNEATAWAWEFITKVLEIPIDKIWVSIYLDDDEAFKIWTEKVGVAPDRIVRLGKADNFWEIGAGPCGPSSEIYFDRGEKYGCDNPNCAVGCDCDRYVEFWNLVFTQFNSDGHDNYTPLEKPNIDTGMGLERVACIMQGVGNLFEVDTVQNIMRRVSELAKVNYGDNEKTDVSLRIITDHIRSTTFMIADGIVPQNEGRGYVLRRLLRRAARHGKLIGINEPFLFDVAKIVIKENESAYPDLLEKIDYIIKVITIEEGRFEKTINQGVELLTAILDKLDKEELLSGEMAFKLYDTYGFPIDLTKEIVAEKNINIDEQGFEKFMNEQKKRAREARSSMNDVGWEDDILSGITAKTNFTGYSKIHSSAKIIAIVSNNEIVENITVGDSARILLNCTPFYAESGGQIGDVGVITVGENIFKVYDCKKSATGHFMHIGEMQSGIVSVGDECTAKVDISYRHAIMRNHTACHLLQEALREVLGNHVHQSGSMVSESVCRFDFSHFDAMTTEEILKVENRVNELILDALDVKISEMHIDEAKKLGAMALFGEKYGSTVRVCNVSNESIELCGGIHVPNTAQIGLFKIIRESSVAAGIRRIEAATGEGVLKLLDETNHILAKSAANLKLNNPLELPAKTAAIVLEMKEKEKALAESNQVIADSQVNGLFQNSLEVGPVRLILGGFTGTKPEALRAMSDKIRNKAPKMVAVLSTIYDGKATIVTVCGKEAVAAGVHAGKLIKEITALVNGNGGGKAESAMGSATDIFKIDEAFAQVHDMVRKQLG